MNDDDMTDRHLGDDATITIPLRTALDLWMLADGDNHHSKEGFEEALDAASRDAGFDGIVDAYHRCGPGVIATADGTRGRRVRT